VEESSRRRFVRNVHVKDWNFLFYCSNIAKSENAMLWRMLSRLETCIVYCRIWSVALAKSIVPRKTWRKLWHSYFSELFLTKMQVKFSIFLIPQLQYNTLVPRKLLYAQSSFLLYILLCPKPTNVRLKKITKQYYH
jgi:hypothetical protein